MALGEEEGGEHNGMGSEAPDPSFGSLEGGNSGANAGAPVGYTDVMTSESDTQRDPDDSGLGRSADQTASSTQDLKYPTPATDFFTGPATVPPKEDGSSLVGTSAASSTARRQTSHSGSPALDQLSLVTVLSQRGILSLAPEGGDISYSNGCSDEPKSQSSFPESFPLNVQLTNLEVDESLNAWSLEDSFEPFQSTEENTTETATTNADDRAVEINDSQLASEVTGRQLNLSEVHKSQLMSGIWLDPVYPSLATVASRMATFDGVRVLDGVRVDKLQFAQNGFFFKVKEENTSVICFHCGCSPREWEEDMDPRAEHIILSPRCRAVFP